MEFFDIVGPHPAKPHPLGVHISATDECTNLGTPHRVLNDLTIQSNEFIEEMKQWIINHHVSPENIERDRRRRETLEKHGFQDQSSRFPTNPSTQKGNWGEIFLAEYLISSCNTQLPVYRLRYNTNVDQSMKGDDVLVFDFNSNPVRVLVGEAKYRATPTKEVVKEIVEALTKSHQGGIPISLGFVSDRLFGEGNAVLGEKVDECNILFVQGNLQIDHVGLLVSNTNAAANVCRNASSSIQRLALMSLGLNAPDDTVTSCFDGIENHL